MRAPDGPDVVVLDFGSRTGEVVVTSERSGRPAPELLTRIRSLLDLDTDAAAVAEHLAQDPALAPAVVAAAAEVADGSLDLSTGRDPDALRADLLALRGVGPWTAAYVAMRLAHDTDVLLTTDLVVRQGAAVLGADLARSERWSPFRSYATMHLWRAALAARPGS